MTQATVSADVAIIGAGLTALTAALLLQERGRSVVVLENATTAGGESGNTIAQLTTAIDAGYHSIRRKYGVAEARLVAEAGNASLEKIAELVQQHSIACRFRRVPGYLYTEHRKSVAELKSEASAAREAGLDVQWTPNAPLPFATRGAVVFANQAQFHPREYLNALAALVTRAEAGHVNAGTSVPITTTATHRTYAMAFESEGEHVDGWFRDTADPYHTASWQETDEGTFLIVGGESHRIGESDAPEARFAKLLAFARDRFRVRKPREQWAEIVEEPVLATLGAMLIADEITGVENRWKNVFSARDAIRAYSVSQ
jgi:hypothetical protein